MSDETPSKSVNFDRLAVAVRLADECRHGLRRLGEVQEACALQFRLKERELIELLSRLQTLVEEQQLAPVAESDEIREWGLPASFAVPAEPAIEERPQARGHREGDRSDRERFHLVRVILPDR